MHAVVNLWQECRSALVRRTAVIPRPAILDSSR